MRIAKDAIVPLGDCAAIVRFGSEISPNIHRQCMAFSDELERRPIAGTGDIVPTFCAVTVHYDPMRLTFASLSKEIRKRIKRLKPAPGNRRRVVEIPVCYQGGFAPDLDRVAHHAGLTPEEVVRIHSAADYLIYMLGFLPGFAYLGGLDKRLHTPRLEHPRTLIPAGSVGIGGEQTGIYPLASPGGWHLIGRTPVKPYDADREQPFLYQSGESIRFVPIDEETYRQIEQQVRSGAYRCTVREVAG